MRYLDRTETELWAACVTGAVQAADADVSSSQADPGPTVWQSVDFGPELRTVVPAGGKLRSACGRQLVRTSSTSVVRFDHSFVRRHHVELIHTSDRPRDAFVCVLIARLTGAKCIIHAHVAYGEWMSGLLKWSLKRADSLIAVSNFVASTLVASGHSVGKIDVVLNAIDLDEVDPGHGRAEARREFDIPEDAPLVITVCRLFPAKGAEELIRAVPELRREFSPLSG